MIVYRVSTLHKRPEGDLVDIEGVYDTVNEALDMFRLMCSSIEDHIQQFGHPRGATVRVEKAELDNDENVITSEVIRSLTIN
jgi:hypothetical protein